MGLGIVIGVGGQYVITEIEIYLGELLILQTD